MTALTASSNAFSTGVQDNDNYAPLIKSSFPSNNPNSSGIVVQNASPSGGDKLVSTVYETKLSGSWRMQHSGFLAGSTTVILPRIYKNHPDGSATWSTGIQVQNTGTTSADQPRSCHP